MAASTPAIERYVGDDWTIGPVSLTAGAAAMDLTGATVTADVYAAFQASPVVTLAEGAGVTVAADRTTGVLTDLWVQRAVTAAVPSRGQPSAVPPSFAGPVQYPTRIDIVVTDSRGRRNTVLIIPVVPLDPRIDLP